MTMDTTDDVEHAEDLLAHALVQLGLSFERIGYCRPTCGALDDPDDDCEGDGCGCPCHDYCDVDTARIARTRPLRDVFPAAYPPA